MNEELDCIRQEMHKPGHPVTIFLFSKVIVLLIWVFFKLGVPPNAITLIKIVLSLAVGLLLSLNDGWFMMVFGAIGVYISSCLDYVDGCVARLSNKTSAFGAWLDNIAENGVFLFYFFGAAIGWQQIEQQAPAYIVLSILLALKWLQQLAMQSAVIHFSTDKKTRKCVY